MKDFDFYDISITIIAVVFISTVIGFMGYIVYRNYHNPCVEWEKTNGMSCYNYGSFTNCQQTKECVRRQKQ